MRRRKAERSQPDFRIIPFSELIKKDARLAEIRQTYANRTAEERRQAADSAYHASCANDLFVRALPRIGQESPFSERWPPGVEALAIDPVFAPALLTVGSMEYQIGRKEEAKALFHALFTLPDGTADLVEIIDEAGTFLLDQDDFAAAYEFYQAACAVCVDKTQLLGGLGYSLAKLRRRDEAVAVQRRAVALEPANPELLNDLGWALTENGQYAEAERVLNEAVALAPPEYERPRGNLARVRRLMKSRKLRRA